MSIIGIATLLLVGAEGFAPIRSASSRRFAPRYFQSGARRGLLLLCPVRAPPRLLAAPTLPPDPRPRPPG